MADLLYLAIADTTPKLSCNLLDDVAAPFRYQFMIHAFEAGTVVALVAGAIGYFVLLRGTASAPPAPSPIGPAGSTGAVVLAGTPGFGPLASPLGAAVST